MSIAIVCARLRVPLILVGAAGTVGAGPLGASALTWPALAVGLVGLALYFRVGTPRRAPVEVACPVAGRWLAVHSPRDRVPSHGLHAYGQTYAIDLSYQPAGWTRPGSGWWPLVRRPEEFPAFGQPVLAAADGVVVRRRGWEPDHHARTSSPAVLLLLVLGSLRELFGPSFVVGNHVVIRHGPGLYSACAHLRRHSVRVAVGDRVVAGQQIAECGNTGNSTEPHLHFQLMDRKGFPFAAGLPFRFARYEVDGEVRAGVPGEGELFGGIPVGAAEAPPLGRR